MPGYKIDTRTLTILSFVFVSLCLRSCSVEKMRNPRGVRPVCKSNFKAMLDYWGSQNRNLRIISETIRKRQVDIVRIYPGLFRTAEEEYRMKSIHVRLEPETTATSEATVEGTEAPLDDTLLMTQPSSDLLERDMCCPTLRTMRPYRRLTNLFNVSRQVVHAPGRDQYIHEGRCQRTNIACGCHGGSCLGNCYEVSGIQHILVYNETRHTNFEPFSIRSHCACLNLQTGD